MPISGAAAKAEAGPVLVNIQNDKLATYSINSSVEVEAVAIRAPFSPYFIEERLASNPEFYRI